MEELECSSLIDEVIEAAGILFFRGLNTLRTGNVSARCGDFIVMTPSGADKHALTRRDLVFYDLKRMTFIGFRRPTSEYRMHIQAYTRNEQIKSVVHAHNPKAVEALRGASLAGLAGVEEANLLGRLCIAERAPPGSQELANSVGKLSRDCDVIILPEHGAVAFGDRPLTAVEKLLVLERIAELILASRSGVRANR